MSSTIGNLPDSGALDGTELVEVEKGGNSRKSDLSGRIVTYLATLFGRLANANTWTAAQTWQVNSQFTVTTGSTQLDVNNPVAANGACEVMNTQNFAGNVGALWNSRKARNSAGALSVPSVNDEIGRFEMRSFTSGSTYKSAARFRAVVGTLDITGGGSTPSGYWQWLSRGSGDTGNFDCTLETMRITHLGAVHFPQLGTTASAANAYIDSGASPANQLLRSTSRGEFKEDIEPIWPERIAKAMDELQPRYWHSKLEGDKLDNGQAKSFDGFVAEEVAAVDPRFAHWGWRAEDLEAHTTFEDVPDNDDEGNAIIRQEKRVEIRPKEGAVKVPDGINTTAILAMAVAEIQSLRRDNADLKARVAALEARR